MKREEPSGGNIRIPQAQRRVQFLLSRLPLLAVSDAGVLTLPDGSVTSRLMYATARRILIAIVATLPIGCVHHICELGSNGNRLEQPRSESAQTQPRELATRTVSHFARCRPSLHISLRGVTAFAARCFQRSAVGVMAQL